MEEKIIKWSSKKIIWTIVLCLVELAFLLWILSFMMTYPKEAPVGLVVLILFVDFLIIIVSLILYQRLQIFLSDKEYLKCTVQGFSYKPYPKKDWQFYSWEQVKTFSLMRIRVVEVRGIFDYKVIKCFENPNLLAGCRFTTKSL